MSTVGVRSVVEHAVLGCVRLAGMRISSDDLTCGVAGQRVHGQAAGGDNSNVDQ